MLHKFFALLLFASFHAMAATPAELLAAYSTQAGQPANAVKGEAFFKASHGQEWQCTSCHSKSPMTGGRHASTDKAIEPLAPAANAKRFEFSAGTRTVADLMALAKPQPTATHVRVTRNTGTVRNTEYYPLSDAMLGQIALGRRFAEALGGAQRNHDPCGQRPKVIVLNVR